MQYYTNMSKSYHETVKNAQINNRTMPNTGTPARNITSPGSTAAPGNATGRSNINPSTPNEMSTGTGGSMTPTPPSSVPGTGTQTGTPGTTTGTAPGTRTSAPMGTTPGTGTQTGTPSTRITPGSQIGTPPVTTPTTGTPPMSNTPGMGTQTGSPTGTTQGGRMTSPTPSGTMNRGNTTATPMTGTPMGMPSQTPMRTPSQTPMTGSPMGMPSQTPTRTPSQTPMSGAPSSEYLSPVITYPYSPGGYNSMYVPVNIPYNTPMGIPLYPIYGYDNSEDLDRDIEYMKQLYPYTARVIQKEVDDECDKLEYDGSLMFDEYPDKTSLDRIADRVYDKIKNIEEEPQVEANSIYNYPSRRRNFLRDIVSLILLNEIFNRRRHHRSRRRWF